MKFNKIDNRIVYLMSVYVDCCVFQYDTRIDDIYFEISKF